MKLLHSPQLRLLLVAEESEQRTFLEFSLSRAGYTVLVATSEEEAMATVARERLHLVLIGECIAARQGFIFCARLRTIFTLSIVILAPLIHPDDLITAFRLGADDYIVKPIATNVLLARLSAVVRRARKNTPRHRWPVVLPPEVICSTQQ
jgi:DNA-binding response OmpR family regulator